MCYYIPTTQKQLFPNSTLQVELVQVATPTLLACVDCALFDASTLAQFAQMLCEREIVVHSATKDLEIVRDLGGTPKRVFDTQVSVFDVMKVCVCSVCVCVCVCERALCYKGFGNST